MTVVIPELTPLMRQYHEIKKQYPDTLLFFQVGDFYELFFDDAKKAAAFLGIALTKRGKINGEPIPLCGVPIHARDYYVSKLIKGGFRVALCDQLEEPKPGKVVDRGITRIFTPGTLTDDNVLNAKSASYLFSFFPAQDQWGLLFGELMTAQLFATLVPPTAEKQLEAELIRFFPDEILIPPTAMLFDSYFKKLGYFTTIVHPELALDDTQKEAQAWMNNQLLADNRVALAHYPSLQGALYHFYLYVRQTQQAALSQFNNLHVYKSDDFLVLDAATQRNLELVKNTQDGSTTHTLFDVLDGALTPMGSRMIKKWILRPLVKSAMIEQRHTAIETVIAHATATERIETVLKQIGDIERVIGRIALKRATLHDYRALARSLELMPELVNQLDLLSTSTLLQNARAQCADFSNVYALLTAALNDDETKEWIIKSGFDKQLDEIRDLVEHAQQKILELEAHEQHITGINSLKIRFNQAYGYSIEVTKTHSDSIPDRYIRQQTLVGRERYMTPELQQLQAEINRARAEINIIENAVFERVKQEVATVIAPLRKLAHALAHLDAILGIARVSHENGYVRPVFNANRDIIITAGRHPVIEKQNPHSFIANDTHLTDAESTWIITGPNMGGKSTYLRQVAHISIMAQIGSFVPASLANLPILDRIFTRIGAGDNLAQGKSTFLVEMEETATICTQATANSLVILDEVGRGTSTFDGLAIAQAVIEYIHNHLKARCLFATHYHELTQLQSHFAGMSSYYASSKKTPNGVLFLYKMIKGVADGSFGVEVAKLAQLPPLILARAQHILMTLSAAKQDQLSLAPLTQDALAGAYQQLQEQYIHLKKSYENVAVRIKQQEEQLKIITAIDYDNLSPKKAFDLLWELKK